MTIQRPLTAAVALLADLSIVAAPAHASPLLSGYGGPGQGSQAILGATLLNAPRTSAGPGGPAATPATGGGATSQLSLGTNPEGQLKFDKSTLSAKAGKVSIAYENKSPIEHNLTIESSSGASIGATPTFQGGSKTLTVTLKPGTYKFFCSVPGHRQAGMEGTLTVK